MNWLNTLFDRGESSYPLEADTTVHASCRGTRTYLQLTVPGCFPCARAKGFRGRRLAWRRSTIGTTALTLLHTFLHPQLILLKLLFLVIV
jgi:hypothetical protein